jgi:phosphate-selective porin
MKTSIILAACLSVGVAFGQTTTTDSTAKKVETLSKDMESLKNLKVSGWIQAQFQWTQTPGAVTYDGGNFAPNSDNRFMIRRGRVKFTYTQKLSQYVLQINATERGLNLVDFYANVKDPWTKQFSLTAGVMNRPFGFEIQQSSAVRETPERSRFTQILLPNERDLGAMITYQPTKGKKMYGLKVDAGFYNGTGIAVPGTTSLNLAGVVDFDKYKDFIAHAVYQRTTKSEKIQYGFGGSYYNGGVVYQNNRVYRTISPDMNGIATWVASDTTSKSFKGGRSPREYYDVEFQLSINSKLGKTTIRSEYMFGNQTGTLSSTKSPASLSTEKDTYIRSFDGFYTYFIQRIGKTKHEFALKYEWYDPNKTLNSHDFVAGTAMKDSELKYQMLGIGYSYYLDDNVKFMLYYNLVKNETAQGIAGYTKDLKDDVFTVRVQYRF